MNDVGKRFTISVTGDTTGEKWVGLFVAKRHLSLRDVLRRDQRRRELLGGLAGGLDPSPEAASAAIALSELHVRLAEAPPWWDAAGEGVDLLDANVVVEVFQQAMAAEREAVEALRKQGDEARQAIEKAPEVKEAAASLPSSAAFSP